MNSRLPDVATDEKPQIQSRLDWVGMQGIDLPLMLDTVGAGQTVAATVDAQVNLPEPSVKGIHMSRLYRLLDQYAQSTTVTPQSIAALLAAMTESHRDCHATQSRLAMSFSSLARRAALVTPGLYGWQSYPVRIEGRLVEGVTQLRLSVSVLYSSTCPCSAALARQMVRNAFEHDFSALNMMPKSAVLDWLEQYASIATPHSQRSEAKVCVEIAPDADSFRIDSLISSIELALGTAVQTAVKRADEQAFASLNGKNLMYVEDAARKIQNVIHQQFGASSVQVVHMESLHAHDATAEVSSFTLP